MRHLLFSLWTAAFLLYAAPFLWASYSNPTLKVLLFQSSGTVLLKNENGLKTSKPQLDKRRNRSIRVRRTGGNGLLVDGRFKVGGVLKVTGKGTIQVVGAGARPGRKCYGTIEIRSHSRGLHIINHIPTETYLEGVLNAEISTRWHMEAVKAQAVVSRTYALFKREIRSGKQWHLTSGSQDQYYTGANMIDRKGKRAIRETEGTVVSYRGRLAQTFYHSNCGGVTEDPAALWQFALPYLKVKTVPYGKTDPRYSWQHIMDQRDVRRILERARLHGKGPVRDILVRGRTASNRAAKLAFVRDNGKEFMNASRFRRLAGYDKIQSLLLDVVKTAGGFHFKGYGHGHGVGLCQWAAKEMAEVGYRYRDILHYFYDGIRIRRYRG